MAGVRLCTENLTTHQVGSGLANQGLSDVELENICRLQYARWKDLQEYVSAVGQEPDLWPNGLIKVPLMPLSSCSALRSKTQMHAIILNWYGVPCDSGKMGKGSIEVLRQPAAIFVNDMVGLTEIVVTEY